MFADRPYASSREPIDHGGYGGFGGSRLTPAVAVLLLVTCLAFLLQAWAERFIGPGVRPLFALSSWGLLRGMIWQPLTYLLLHGGFGHLLFNMLGLFFLGPEAERELGTRRFVTLYLMAGVLGGLGWILFDALQGWAAGGPPGFCIGASGAVLGVVGAFAALFPERRITLLLFFVLPVSMTARTMGIGFAAISLYIMLLGDRGGVAHAAHLFGLLAGYLYGRRQRFRPAPAPRSPSTARGRWFRAGGRGPADVLPFPTAQPPDAAEVDRILDKISTRGMGSLTARERETLDRASGRL
jgi:membrane associated rhomboid family serine protease